jgi:DNA-nicking Smr family endonuclease
MGRRRNPAAGTGSKAKKDVEPSLNTPFRELKQRLRAESSKPQALAKAPPQAKPPTRVEPSSSNGDAAPDLDDPALFERAMAGVVVMPHGHDERVGNAPRPARPPDPKSEEAEALAALSDLVTGTATFDITDTHDYVEGAVVGLDPRVLRRLRRGDFAWQRWIDLHGMIAPDARAAVERFLQGAFRDGLRCVLIVHGKGMNSKDQTPVLKERLKTWLARGRVGKVVLAFSSARQVDGGAGALYVLLRRDRRARPIEVLQGAKR